MANYTNLSPTDAIALWYQTHGPNNLTPADDPSDLSWTKLAQQNPAAWSLIKTGMNDTGTTRQIFNPSAPDASQLWQTQQDKGFWSHPESWLQLAFGGGLGAAGAGLLGPRIGGAAQAGNGTAAAARAGGEDATTGIGSAVGAGGEDATTGIGAGTAAAGAGSSALAKLFTNPNFLKALAGIGGVLGGHALVNSLNPGADAIPPQLQTLIDASTQRYQAQQPLFNAVNQGLYQMLPTFAKK